MLAKTMWVLIADGGRARVLEHKGAGSGLAEVKGLTFSADHRPSHDLGTEKPARSYDSVGSGRHAVEPRVDPHRELKRSFAYQLADVLDAHLAKRDFARLVLVAPPQLLGDLRNAISPAVRAKLTAEVAKDLTKVPDHEVASHLKDVVKIT